MKRKAKILWDFLKKVWNLIWDFANRYTEIIAIVVIVVLIRYTVIFNKNDSKDLDGTLIGVAFALVVGLKQIYISNKNVEDNIQIRKAEFTNKLIKEFRNNMSALHFCAYLCKNYNESDDELIRLHEKLLENDVYDFSIIEYKKLKNDLRIDDSKIREAKANYFSRTQHIIDLTEEHYKNNKLNGYCIFHEAYEQYIKDLYDVKKHKYNSNEKEETEKLKQRYVDSIFSNMQNVLNNFECSSLSAQFDLLDYDKITNLVYAPLYHYISNLYIRMMEHMIDSADENIVIYSNIKKFCSEVVRVKKRFDEEMDAEKRNSEKRKEKIMSIAVKKL